MLVQAWLLLALLFLIGAVSAADSNCSQITLPEFSTPKDCPNCTYVFVADGPAYCRDISLCDVVLNYSLPRPYGCPEDCQLETRDASGEEFCSEITFDDYLINLYWGRNGQFPYGYLFWNILTVLAVILFLQYTPVLLGMTLTWLVNHLVLQPKSEFFHVRGMSVMIVGGRAIFTGIEYLSPNVHVKCVELSVNIKWWRGTGDIRQAPSSTSSSTASGGATAAAAAAAMNGAASAPAAAAAAAAEAAATLGAAAIGTTSANKEKRSKLPFRMSFFFTGLEISIFNNSPRYELVEGYVVKAIYRTVFGKEPPQAPMAAAAATGAGNDGFPTQVKRTSRIWRALCFCFRSRNANNKRAAKIAKESTMNLEEDGIARSNSGNEEGAQPVFASAFADGTGKPCVDAVPSMYTLFPITRVQCRNFVLYVGAPTLPTTVIVHIQRAVGLHFTEPIGPDSSNYGLDSYRVVNKFDFRGVVVTTKPNTGFVASDEVEVLRQRMDNKNAMDANGFFNEIIRNLRSSIHDVKIGMKDVRTDLEKTLAQTLPTGVTGGGGGGGGSGAAAVSNAAVSSPQHHDAGEEEYEDGLSPLALGGNRDGFGRDDDYNAERGGGIGNVISSPRTTAAAVTAGSNLRQSLRHFNRTSKRSVLMDETFLTDKDGDGLATSMEQHEEQWHDGRGNVVDDGFAPILPSAKQNYARNGGGEDEEEEEEGVDAIHQQSSFQDDLQQQPQKQGDGESRRGLFHWLWWWPTRKEAANDVRRDINIMDSFDEENGTLLRRNALGRSMRKSDTTGAKPQQQQQPSKARSSSSRGNVEEPNLLRTGKVELFIHLDQPGRVSATEADKYAHNKTVLPPPRQSLIVNMGGGGEEEGVFLAYGPWADRQRALFLEHFFPFLSEDQTVYVPKLGQRREALAVDIRINFVRLGELRLLYREQDLGLLMTDGNAGGSAEDRGIWAELQRALKERFHAQQQSDAAEEKAERAKQQKLARLRASQAQIRRTEDQHELPGTLALREIERDAWLLCDGLDVNLFVERCRLADDAEEQQADAELLVNTFNAMASFQHSLVKAIPFLNPSLFPVSEYLTWSAMDKARWLWGEFSGRESCIFPPPSPSFSDAPSPEAICELKRCWEALPVPPFLQDLAVRAAATGQARKLDLLALCALEPDAARRGELEVAVSDPRSRLSAWYSFPSNLLGGSGGAVEDQQRFGRDLDTMHMLHSRNASAEVPATTARESHAAAASSSSNARILPAPHDTFAGPISNAHKWNTTCGYMDILVQPGSAIQVTLAMYPTAVQEGCSTSVTVDLKKPRLYCSVTRSTIADASSLRAECSIFYPIVWNETQIWQVAIQANAPVLKFLRADMQALLDLSRDWASNTVDPPSVGFFIPILYQVNVTSAHCELRLNVNESNAIDLPEETMDHNTMVSILIPNVSMQVRMDALEYKPASAVIHVDWSWMSDSVLGIPIRCTLLHPAHHPRRSIPMANKLSGGGQYQTSNSSASVMPDAVFLEMAQIKSSISYEYHDNNNGVVAVDSLDCDMEFDNFRLTAYPEALLAVARFQENYLGAHVCFASKDLYRGCGGENFKTLLAYRAWTESGGAGACRKVVENEFAIRVRFALANSLLFFPTGLYPRLTSEGVLRHPDEDAITLFTREMTVEIQLAGEHSIEYNAELSPIRVQVPNMDRRSAASKMGAKRGGGAGAGGQDHFAHERDTFARLFQQTSGGAVHAGFSSAFYDGSSTSASGNASSGSAAAAAAAAAAARARAANRGAGGEVGQLIVDGLRANLHSSYGRVLTDPLAPLVPYRTRAKCTLGAVWGDLEMHQVSQIRDALLVFELMLARSKSFDRTNGGTRDPTLCTVLPIGHLDTIESKLQFATQVLGVETSTSASAAAIASMNSANNLQNGGTAIRQDPTQFAFPDDSDGDEQHPRARRRRQSTATAPQQLDTSNELDADGEEEEDEDGDIGEEEEDAVGQRRRLKRLDSSEDLVIVPPPPEEEPVTICFSVELNRVANLPRQLEKRAALSVQMVCGGQGYLAPLPASLLRTTTAATGKDAQAREGYCFLAGMGGGGADLSDLKVALYDTSFGVKRLAGEVRFSAQALEERVAEFKRSGFGTSAAAARAVFEGSYALDATQCHRTIRQFTAPVQRTAYSRQFPPGASGLSAIAPSNLVLPATSYHATSKLASIKLTIRLFAIRGSIAQLEASQSQAARLRRMERVFETASAHWKLEFATASLYASAKSSSAYLPPVPPITNVQEEERKPRDLALDARLVSLREWRSRFIANAASHIVQTQAMNHVANTYAHNELVFTSGPITVCTWATAWDSVVEWSLRECKLKADTLCNDKYAWKVSSEDARGSSKEDCVQVEIKHLKHCAGEDWSMIGRIHFAFDPRMFGTRGANNVGEMSKQAFFIQVHDAANKIRRARESAAEANRGEHLHLVPAMASAMHLMPRILRPTTAAAEALDGTLEQYSPRSSSSFSRTRSARATSAVGGDAYDDDGGAEYMSAFGSMATEEEAYFEDCEELPDGDGAYVDEDQESDDSSYVSAAQEPSKPANVYVSSRRYGALPFESPIDCSSTAALDAFLPTYRVTREVEPNDYWLGGVSGFSSLGGNNVHHQKRELAIAPSSRTSITRVSAARLPIKYFSADDANVASWQKLPVLQRQFTPTVPDSSSSNNSSANQASSSPSVAPAATTAAAASIGGAVEDPSSLDTISIRIHLSDIAEVFLTPASICFVEDSLHEWFPSAPSVTKMVDYFERNYLVLSPLPRPVNRLAERSLRVNVLFSSAQGVALCLMHSSRWNAHHANASSTSKATKTAATSPSTNELVYSTRLSTGALTIALKSLDERASSLSSFAPLPASLAAATFKSKTQSAVIDISNTSLVVQVASAFDLLQPPTPTTNPLGGDKGACFPVLRIAVSETLLIQTRQELQQPDLSNHLISSSTASFHGADLVAGVDSIYASYSVALTWGDLVSGLLIESAAIWNRQRRQWAVLAGQLFVLAKRIDDTEPTAAAAAMRREDAAEETAGEVPKLASALISWCKTERPHDGNGKAEVVPHTGFSTLVRTRRILCFLAEHAGTEERMMDVGLDRHFYASPIVSLETISGARSLFPNLFVSSSSLAASAAAASSPRLPPQQQQQQFGVVDAGQSLCRKLVVELLRGVANRVVVKKRSLASSTKSFEFRLEGMMMRVLDASHKEEGGPSWPKHFATGQNEVAAAAAVPMLHADSLCMFVHIRPVHLVFVQRGTRGTTAQASSTAAAAVPKDRRASDMQLRRRLVPTNINETIRATCAGMDVTAAPELILASRAGATVTAHFQDLVLYRDHERKAAFQVLKKEKDALEAPLKRRDTSTTTTAPGGTRLVRVNNPSGNANGEQWEALQTPRRKENDVFFFSNGPAAAVAAASSPEHATTAAAMNRLPDAQSMARRNSLTGDVALSRSKPLPPSRVFSDHARNGPVETVQHAPLRRTARGSFVSIGEKLFGSRSTTALAAAAAAASSREEMGEGAMHHHVAHDSFRASNTAAPVPSTSNHTARALHQQHMSKRIVTRNVSVAVNVHACAFRFTSASLKEREGRIVEDRSALVTLAVQGCRVSWTEVLSNQQRLPSSSGGANKFRDFGLFLIRGVRVTVEGDGRISKRGMAWRMDAEMDKILVNVVRDAASLETRVFADSTQSKCTIPLHAIDNQNLKEYVDRWVGAFRVASDHAEMMRLGNLLERERKTTHSSAASAAAAAAAAGGEDTVEEILSRSLFALGLPTLAREFSHEEDMGVAAQTDLAWMDPFAEDQGAVAASSTTTTTAGAAAGAPVSATAASSSAPGPSTTTTTTRRSAASRVAAAQQQFDYVKENASALLRVVLTLRMHDLDITLLPSAFAKFKLRMEHVTLALDRRASEAKSALAYFSPSAMQFDKKDQRAMVVDFNHSLPSCWVIAKSTTRHRSALTKSSQRRNAPTQVSTNAAPAATRRDMVTNQQVTVLVESIRQSFTPGIFQQFLTLQSGLSAEISFILDSIARLSAEMSRTASSSNSATATAAALAGKRHIEAEYLFYLEGLALQALARSKANAKKQIWGELETKGLEMRVRQTASLATSGDGMLPPSPQYSLSIRDLKLCLVASDGNISSSVEDGDKERLVHLIKILSQVEIGNVVEEEEGEERDTVCVNMNQNHVVIRPLVWIKFAAWLEQYTRAFRQCQVASAGEDKITLEEQVDRYAKQVWQTVKSGSVPTAAGAAESNTKHIQCLRVVLTSSSLFFPLVDHHNKLAALVCTLDQLELLARSEVVYEQARDGSNRAPRAVYFAAFDSTGGGSGSIKKPRRFSSNNMPAASAVTSPPPTTAELSKGLIVQRKRYVARLECTNLETSYVALGAERLLPLRWISSVVHKERAIGARRRCSFELPLVAMSVVGEDMEGKTDWKIVLTISSPQARCDRSLAQCIAGVQRTWMERDHAVEARKEMDQVMLDASDVSDWHAAADMDAHDDFEVTSRAATAAAVMEEVTPAAAANTAVPRAQQQQQPKMGSRKSSLQALLVVHRIDLNVKLESGKCQLFGDDPLVKQRKSNMASVAKAAAAAAAATASAAQKTTPSAAASKPAPSAAATSSSTAARGPRQAMVQAQRALVRGAEELEEETRSRAASLKQPYSSQARRQSTSVFSQTSDFTTSTTTSASRRALSEETFVIDLPGATFSSIYTTNLESHHDVRGHLVVASSPFTLSPALFAFLEDVLLYSLQPSAETAPATPPVSLPASSSSKMKIVLTARLTPFELNLKRSQEQITASLKLQLDNGADFAWTFGPASDQLQRKTASYVSINVPSIALVLHEAHPALELAVKRVNIAFHQIDQVFEHDPMFTALVYVESVHSKFSLWRVESFFALRKEWEEAWEEIDEERRVRNHGAMRRARRAAKRATTTTTSTTSKYVDNLKRFEEMVARNAQRGSEQTPLIDLVSPTAANRTAKSSWSRSSVLFLSLRISSIVSESQLGVLASTLVVKITEVSSRLTLPGQVEGPKRNPDPDLFHFIVRQVVAESTGAYEGVLECKRGFAVFYAREKPVKYNDFLLSDAAAAAGGGRGRNTLNRLALHCPSAVFSFSRVFNAAETVDSEASQNRTILIHVSLTAMEVDVRDEVITVSATAGEEYAIVQQAHCSVDTALVHASVSAPPILLDALDRLNEEIRLAQRAYLPVVENVYEIPSQTPVAAVVVEEVKALPGFFVGTLTLRVHNADLSLVHDASSTVWGTTVSGFGARLAAKRTSNEGMQRTMALVFSETDIFRYSGKGALVIMHRPLQATKSSALASGPAQATPATSSASADESEEEMVPTSTAAKSAAQQQHGVVSQEDAARRATEARRERHLAIQAKKQGKRNIVLVPKASITMTSSSSSDQVVTYTFTSEFSDVISVSTDQREYAKLREILSHLVTTNRPPTTQAQAEAKNSKRGGGGSVDTRRFVQSAEEGSFVFAPQLNIMGEATPKVMDWFLEQNMGVKRTDLPKQFHLLFTDSFEALGQRLSSASSTFNQALQQGGGKTD